MTSQLIPLLSLLFCLAVPAALHAQGSIPSADSSFLDPVVPAHTPRAAHRVGLLGSLNLLLHHADFNTLPGVPSCCSHYPSGDGTGFAVGGLYEHMLEGGWIVGGRLAYEHIAGHFTDREPTTFIIDGHATPGAFEYRLDAGYGIVMLEPVIGYRLVEGMAERCDLIANAGIAFGLKTGSRYTQKEEIVEPEGYATYADNGSTTRNEYEGEIPEEVAFMMDLRFGLSLDVAVNAERTIAVTPELWYSLGMSPVANTINWSVDGLRLGLALRYALPGATATGPTGP